MKNILKLLTMTSSFVLISSNSGIITGCSLFDSGLPNYERNYNVSMLRYKDLPANSREFVQYYEQQIHKAASADSNLTFNQLYDNNPSSGAFSSYNQLNDELAKTQMGAYTCLVNWPALYESVNLTGNILNSAQTNILRFNNILANVYGKTNTLRLVQSNEVNVTEGTTIAYTASTWPVDEQWMVFGPKFADKALIDDQYQQGYWATHNIVSVPVHEYGHALSNLFGVEPSARDNINNNWTRSSKYKSNLAATVSSTFAKFNNNIVKNFSSISAIPNRAEMLMAYLDLQGHNFAVLNHLSNYYDPAINSDFAQLFPYVVLESNYGRSAWQGGLRFEDEFFAEAFTTWLLTPQNERGWNWELFNKFFIDFLPQFIDKK